MIKTRKTVIKKRKLKKIFNIFDIIKKKYNNYNLYQKFNHTYYKCILESINIDIAKKYIKILSTCNCCKMHKNNCNPTLENKCKCNCRTYYRLLLNLYNIKNKFY